MKTRQQRWQERRVAEGRCRRCGSERGEYAQFCDDCARKHAEDSLSDYHRHKRSSTKLPAWLPFRLV